MRRRPATWDGRSGTTGCAYSTTGSSAGCSSPASPSARSGRPPASARESDNLIYMKELTATEAARRFSEVLDAVEHRGESFVVKRRGKTIARIGPAAPSTAGGLKEILRKYPVDSDWEKELRELRESLPVQERSWPH